MWIPPIWIRRVTLGPAVFALAVVSLLLGPLLFLIAVVADLFVRGRWKVTRSVRFFLAFMFAEGTGLAAAFILWIASGLGLWVHSKPMQLANYKLLGWWARIISHETLVALGLSVDFARNPKIEGPVLVFSRHAGPGDSVFLASRLIRDFDRHPRIIGKKELEYVPLLDTLGHRLPMGFVRPHPKRSDLALKAVTETASSLGPNDAFVLFPEGGNYTPRRKARAIEKLETQGKDLRAERAKELKHLLPPHPSGAIAAIEAAPDADVVFVAHTGTEDLISGPIIWTGMPFDRTVTAGYWHVPAADVPKEREAQIAWLDGQWARIDAWIEAVVHPTSETP